MQALGGGPGGAPGTPPPPDVKGGAGPNPARPAPSPQAPFVEAARRRYVALPMPPPGAAGLVRGLAATAAPLAAVVAHIDVTRWPELAVGLAGRTESPPDVWDAAAADHLAFEGRELVPPRLAAPSQTPPGPTR